MSFENTKEKILYYKLKQKDKDAFIEAYNIYIDDIYRFIFYKVSSTETAQDITSTVFLRAWGYIQENSISKEYKSLKSLFYRIARNLVIDHYRKASTSREVNSEALEETLVNVKDDSRDILEELEIKSDFKSVEKSLCRLKDSYREVIILRFINELSVKEVAEVLNKKSGNIRVLIYRALEALKKEVAKTSIDVE